MPFRPSADNIKIARIVALHRLKVDSREDTTIFKIGSQVCRSFIGLPFVEHCSMDTYESANVKQVLEKISIR